MLGAEEARKNKTNMALLSRNVQSIDTEEDQLVTTAPGVDRDLHSRFGLRKEL